MNFIKVSCLIAQAQCITNYWGDWDTLSMCNFMSFSYAHRGFPLLKILRPTLLALMLT